MKNLPMKKLSIGLLAGGFTVASVLTAGSAVATTESGTTGQSAGTSTSSTAASAVSAAGGYQPPPVQFGPCTAASLIAAGAECGFVTVPLDYAEPEGETIKIAISRIKAKTPAEDRQGIMLVNPGGPGGSGLTLSRLGGFVPNGGGDPYDWIGFDPRGVGSSQPSIACDGDYFPTNRPDYRPFTKELERFWLKKSKGYADKCAAQGTELVESGSLLDHLKTRDNVQDMDSIRKALGEKQINYYGFSYGTYLGQVYASEFPGRVRRAVFDGVVDPRNVWYEANLDQDVAFERTENIFFRWVAENDATYGLGTSGKEVRKVWDKMLAKATKTPFDGEIGPDEWTDAFLSAGYYVFGWEDTAKAFKAAVAGDYEPVKALYADANGSGPGSDNGYAVYLGTQCTDLPWPSSWAKIRKDNDRTYAKAPFETWANAWFNGPCSYWQGKADKKAPTVTGKTVAPILLIGETYDAATPFPGAIEVRKRFPKSVLIEGEDGSTHSGSLNGVDCTDNKIAAYLLTGKLPKRLSGNRSDKICDPVPQPVPSGAGRAQQKVGALPADLRAAIAGAQR